MLLDSVPLLEGASSPSRSRASPESSRRPEQSSADPARTPPAATPPLLDSDAIYELLRVTEDLLGPPDVFGALDLLARLGGGGGTDGALKQMQVVRAALARGLAACACLE